MSKQLLIEEAEFTTPIKIEKGLKESISVENNKDVLIVRNIPATIADRKNQNGRIYTTEVLQEAIRNANFQLKTKWMYSQSDEHPEGSFVKPTHASHVVINAYIKKNVKVFVEGKTERHNVMFMDWEILNTEEGKNLKALILQETACPTSIRGLGDMEGEYVTNYELLGCDVVSNPSSGTSMRMPVSESIKVESTDKSYLDESFEVVTVSNDVVSDVEAAAQKQIDIENAKYGTITNIKTKLDQEIDPKTHAETTITSIEATTTDEVSDLNQALQMTQNAFSNPVSKMDSVTITFVDDAEKAKESKESTVADAPNSVEQIDAVAEETEPKKEFLDINATAGDIDVLSAGNLLGGGLGGNKKDEEVEPKKEFLDANATANDINVLTAGGDKEESSEESSSIDDTLINGLQTAIKELNDEILKEKDAEKLKKLKMNRDDLEKLLNKNKDNKAKSEEDKEKKEFLDFGTTQVNGNGATVDSNNTEVDTDIEKAKEESLDNNQSNVQVNGNKLVLQLDKDTTIEKQVGSEKDAQIAKAGLDNGTIDPNFMVTEDITGFNSTTNDDGTTTYSCDGTATYDTEKEKLYNNPDEPSDALVNQPLNDSDDTKVNIVLTDLDYDISDPQNITADDEQFLSELPTQVTVKLNMNEIPKEGEIDQFIIANAATQTGLPIKNAKIKSVSVDLLNDKNEATMTEGENNTFTVYAFLNGQLKDEVENVEAEEEAVQKAEAFKQQYEGQGENFQVIVTRTDDKGFEDFDKLIYQYPDVDIADESIQEYSNEPNVDFIDDEPEEVFDFKNNQSIPDRTMLKDASGSIVQVFNNGDYNADGNLDWTPHPDQLIDDLTNNGYEIVGAWVNGKQIYPA